MKPITYSHEEVEIKIDEAFLSSTYLGRVTTIPTPAIESATLEQVSDDTYTLYVIGRGVTLAELILTGDSDKVMEFYRQVIDLGKA